MWDPLGGAGTVGNVSPAAFPSSYIPTSDTRILLLHYVSRYLLNYIYRDIDIGIIVS